MDWAVTVFNILKAGIQSLTCLFCIQTLTKLWILWN